MNQKDQEKLLDKGFIILRERNTGIGNNKLDIYCKTKMHNFWHLFAGSFISKASRSTCMKFHLNNDFFIED